MILTTAVPGSSPAQSLIFSSVNGVSLQTSHFHPTEMTEILLKLTYNRIPGAVQREEKKTCNQDRAFHNCVYTILATEESEWESCKAWTQPYQVRKLRLKFAVLF